MQHFKSKKYMWVDITAHDGVSGACFYAFNYLISSSLTENKLNLGVKFFSYADYLLYFLCGCRLDFDGQICYCECRLSAPFFCVMLTSILKKCPKRGECWLRPPPHPYPLVWTVHKNLHAKSGLCSSKNERVMLNLVFGAIPCPSVPSLLWPTYI